jgi:phosphoglycolate phosphatase
MARLLDDIHTVAFDLDGTLVDSAPDLASAVNKSLRALRAPALPEERVVSMIGDGIDVLLERALHASLGRPPQHNELTAGLKLVVIKYGECVVDRATLFPGVREGLDALRERGMNICCVTNKYAQLSLPLLRSLDLEGYFAHVLCAETPAQRKPAPVLLQEVCRRAQITPDELLMVGDTRDDIAAARAAGCRVAAVSYGYNSVHTLATDRPDWTIDSLLEISASQ